jgi:DNA primase
MTHLFDLYEQDYKPASKSPASWNGPCPKCGGRKHFVLFRDARRKSKCSQLGSFSCRECGFGGDAIEYLMVVREMTYPAAAEACDVALEYRQQPGYKPRRKRDVPGLPPLPQQSHRQEFQPQESTFGPQVDDPDAWIEHGEKFVEQCHTALLNSREAAPARAWLATRGISERLIILFRVGYHHGERVNGADRQPTCRMAAAWGMPGLKWPDGNPRPKFVIHAGIVIPCYPAATAQGVAGLLRRIAVRRPVGDPKYSQVEGSQGSVKAQMIINPGNDVAVIVESELDGIALSGVLDGITIIPISSTSGRPCVAVNRELRHKSLILIALDRDKDGANTTDWWLRNYRQAQPWCCPAGSFWVHPSIRRDGDDHGKPFKDPGDTIRAGCDQQAWAAEGIALYAAHAPAPAKDDFLPQKKGAQLTGAGDAGKIDAAELLPPAPEAVRRMAELMLLRGGVVLRRMEWGWSPDYRSTPMIWTEAQRQEAIKKKFGGWTDEQYDEAQALFGSAEVLSYLNALPEHISSVTAGDILAAGV